MKILKRSIEEQTPSSSFSFWLISCLIGFLFYFIFVCFVMGARLGVNAYEDPLAALFYLFMGLAFIAIGLFNTPVPYFVLAGIFLSHKKIVTWSIQHKGYYIFAATLVTFLLVTIFKLANTKIFLNGIFALDIDKFMKGIFVITAFLVTTCGIHLMLNSYRISMK